MRRFAFGGGNGLGTVFKLTPPATAGGAWTKSVLYSFTGMDGANPEGSLIFDASGALYGTTYSGGAWNEGTVFQLTPAATPGGAWTERVLYSFMVGTDGQPWESLTLDRSGALYGVTRAPSTVFQLTPPATPGGAWVKTVLHSFPDSLFDYHSGQYPNGSLIFDKSGAIYGTTKAGGDNNVGTVFQLTPPATPGSAWTESVLHSFSQTEGFFPTAGLVFDRCARSLDDGAEKRRCDLRPEAPERGFGHRESRALYGTTRGYGYGGGTVFKLTPPATAGGAWTESVLHTFTGPNAANPFSGVTFDATGALYGTTVWAQLGGACTINFKFGCGTVFKLTPPATADGAWTKTDLHIFTPDEGAFGEGPFPSALVVGRSGALYGTILGGPNGYSGAAFKLTIGSAFAGTPAVAPK